MFKRRRSLSILDYIRQSLWPSMGWQRSFQYIHLRILRLNDTTQSIASGLAIGAAVSFSPLLGTHLIQGIIFAYIFRANVFASLIGTLVGNPWTLPFMLWSSIKMGGFLFGLLGLPSSAQLPVHMDLDVFWNMVMHDPVRVLLPWTVGGYIMALVSWPVSYFIFYKIVKAMRKAGRKVKVLKIHKTAQTLTGQEE